MKYRGITKHKHVVIEDSLSTCLDSLAFVLNHDGEMFASEDAVRDDQWFVYDDLDVAAADYNHRKAWIATIELREFRRTPTGGADASVRNAMEADS